MSYEVVERRIDAWSKLWLKDRLARKKLNRVRTVKVSLSKIQDLHRGIFVIYYSELRPFVSGAKRTKGVVFRRRGRTLVVLRKKKPRIHLLVIWENYCGWREYARKVERMTLRRWKTVLANNPRTREALDKALRLRIEPRISRVDFGAGVDDIIKKLGLNQHQQHILWRYLNLLQKFDRVEFNNYSGT